MRLKPVDALTLGYLGAVSTLVLVNLDRVDFWYEVEITLAAVALTVVAIIAAAHRFPTIRWIEQMRLLYPLVLVTAQYVTIGRYALVFHHTYLDDTINRWELSIFGVHPNLALEGIVSRPLTEFMMAGYVSYFGLFLVPPLILAVRGRLRDLERYVFTLTLTLYICYIGFLIVPLLGPIHALRGSFSEPQLHGYVITRFVHFLMTESDPPGACFPSAHVAGAWVVLLSLRKAFGSRAFWVVAPWSVWITLAVVYTRYHYVSDALAGLAAAVVGYLAAGRLLRFDDRLEIVF